MHNVNDLKLIQSTMSESYLSACQCTLFRCCRSALFRLKAWSQRVHLNRLISEWTSNMWRLMLLRLWNSFPQTGHRKSASPNESNFPLCKGSPKEKKQRLRTLYFWEISGLICKLDHVTKYVSNQIPISKKKKSILLNQFSLRPKTQPYSSCNILETQNLFSSYNYIAVFPLRILCTLNKCCVNTSFRLNVFWHNVQPKGRWSECEAVMCRFMLVRCWILLEQIGHLKGYCCSPWSDLQCCSYVVKVSKLRPHSQ